MPYASKRKTKSQGIVPIASNLLGTCTTSASTATKVVSLSDFDVLVEGVTVHVYFAYSNSASSPKLQVGSTAAKTIRRNGTSTGQWRGGSIISFTYYNDYWIQNDADEFDYIDNDTKYGIGWEGVGTFFDYGSGKLKLVENGSVSEKVIIRTNRITSGDITIASKGYIENTLYVGLSGYAPIGIVGYNLTNQPSGGQNVSYCTVWACEMSTQYQGYAWYQVRNHHQSESAKIRMTVSVLYVAAS